MGVVELKEIGCSGRGGGVASGECLEEFEEFNGLCLCENDLTVLIHVCLLDLQMSCVICVLIVLIRDFSDSNVANLHVPLTLRRRF